MTQQQIDEWNETFPVGSPCWVRYDDGSEHTHHTRSEAYECPCANKGHVVVKVDGLSHSVDLDRIHMAETHELKPHNVKLTDAGGLEHPN